jgi:hypothetical protein
MEKIKLKEDSKQYWSEEYYIGNITYDALEPQTLEITNCERIILKDKSLDFSFELAKGKMEDFDEIVINGVKFKKEVDNEASRGCPAVNPYEWISVEDRLPEKFADVLCLYPSRGYRSNTMVVDYMETEDGYFAEQFKYGVPTHWMPLPEPPKDNSNCIL